MSVSFWQTDKKSYHITTCVSITTTNKQESEPCYFLKSLSLTIPALWYQTSCTHISTCTQIGNWHTLLVIRSQQIIMLQNIFSFRCRQSLFCSKNRGKKQNWANKYDLFEGQAAKTQAATSSAFCMRPKQSRFCLSSDTCASSGLWLCHWPLEYHASFCVPPGF